MSKTFLEQIVSATLDKISRDRETLNIAALREQAVHFRSGAETHRLSKALSRPDRTNIIAEIKRASPSKGVINANVDVATFATQYERGGAAAISVLTENEYFHGSLDDLRTARQAVALPILRKDFIVDEIQIFDAAVAGADAILLIIGALGRDEIARLLELTHSELGMDALVEVHTPEEMMVAASLGANIIGVNNRDLRTLDVSLDVSRSMIEHRPADVMMVSESGISSREQIDELRILGYNGFLVGESLMRNADATLTLGAWI